jgi:glycosyltransferase involved in cell wall biosynthesis
MNRGRSLSREERRQHARTKRCVGWGAMPPPVHGSAVMNQLSRRILAETLEVTWVNSAVSDGAASLGRFSLIAVWRSLRPLVKFLRACVVKRPRLVYISASVDGPAFYRDLAVWAAAKLCARRVVVHLHSGHVMRFQATKWAGVMRLLRRGTQVWVLSEKFAQQLRDGSGPVEVLPNGCDCANPDHGASSPACQSQAPTVLFLSNMFLSKGVDTAVRVARDPRIRGRARFVFAGAPADDAAEELIAALVTDDPMTKRVCKLDASEKCRLLTTSDLLLLPSRYPLEGAPIVVLEALAHGTVPLVTDHGAMSELVGSAGYVRHDVDGFVEALVDAVGPNGDLSRRSAAAVERWHRRFSEDAYRARFRKLLGAVVG